VSLKQDYVSISDCLSYLFTHVSAKSVKKFMNRFLWSFPAVWGMDQGSTD